MDFLCILWQQMVYSLKIIDDQHEVIVGLGNNLRMFNSQLYRHNGSLMPFIFCLHFGCICIHFIVKMVYEINFYFLHQIIPKTFDKNMANKYDKWNYLYF